MKFTLLACIFGLFCAIQSAWCWCKPDQNDVQYTDYIPYYRKTVNDFIISKIEYKERSVVLHFRYVALSDRELIRFHGKGTANAWEVTTSQRANANTESSVRQTDIYNIRINDELKADKISDMEVAEYRPQKGDIVSCEIHFASMPHYIRTINLIKGEVDRSGKERFICLDLQLKTQGSDRLGDAQQMTHNLQAFYKARYVKHPEILEMTSLQKELEFQIRKEEQRHKPAITRDDLDYMPRMFGGLDDLTCNERMIMENVLFEDNNADYSKRLLALRTIGAVVEYMRRFPDAKIILHGHTDIHDNDPYESLKLSKARVEAVQRSILDKGIDRKRVIVRYYGGTQPLPNYRQGGAMNRRVEVEVMCDGGAASTSNSPR